MKRSLAVLAVIAGLGAGGYFCYAGEDAEADITSASRIQRWLAMIERMERLATTPPRMGR